METTGSFPSYSANWQFERNNYAYPSNGFSGYQHSTKAGAHDFEVCIDFGDGQQWEQGEELVVPYWMLSITSALPPFFWTVWKLRRRSRKVNGLCASCAYDLRATPDRCPECGKSVNAHPGLRL